MIKQRLDLSGILVLGLTIGCESPDDRLLQLSRASLEQQAAQNREMARQNQTIADASRELVVADAKARQAVLEATLEIQAERASLDRQHERLEIERREQAQQRNRDPIVANAILSASLLTAVMLPLVLCYFLVRGIYLTPDSETLNELLLAEFSAENPCLLPQLVNPFPRLEHVPETSVLPIQPLTLPAPQAIESVPRVTADQPRAIVVVEGIHDVSFLRRISALLHAQDPSLPDLGPLADRGVIVFMPVGGGDRQAWTHRLEGFGQAEFHLYDREFPPVTAQREQLVAAINRREGCQAFLTSKRAIENYLHPAITSEALGIELSFSDQDDVPDLVARQKLLASGGDWEQLSRSTRKRLRDRAKKQLHQVAVAKMTPRALG